MPTLQDYLRLNTRTASILHVGGFRPTREPSASHFGLVPLAAAGEAWPVSQAGQPLMFICQMNLTTAPAVPPPLADIQLITFFADADSGPTTKENGGDWRLFAYSSIAGLAPLTPPANAPKLQRGFECRWEAADDHPNYDDPERITLDDFDDSEVDLDNVARTKIGGYASTIQSEPCWGYGDHPSKPVFCLQINSEEKVQLAWGDAGTVYIARGSAPGCQQQWFLDMQCY